MKKHYYLKNVATLRLEVDKCIGCEMCTAVCPHAVFGMKGRKAYITDRDACMECGACALNCPVEAIGVDAGVGCANAIIRGSLAGTAPTCGGTCECDAACC